ncbi:iron ABC transporter permease [Amycolatopsis sp. NPDC003731]
MVTLTEPGPPAVAVRRRGRLALLGGGLGALILLGSAVHLTQGTANLDALDVLRLVFGRATGDTTAVVVESRLPRLLAALVVGGALGVAGAVLQSVSRNTLASPDTLAVNAGAHLAVVAVAAFGVSLPLLGAAGIAFAGGLAAAVFVLALSGTGGTGIVRLVLAGTAIALALISVTQVLLLLYAQETRGLFAWGEGSLEQNGLGGIRTLGPVAGVALAVLLGMARQLDLIQVGDDHARTLGVHIGRTRFAAIALAVLLAATAVTLAGPIGFVGLAAPAVARLLATVVPGLHRHAALLPCSAALGAALLLGADVLLRAVIGPQRALAVPTGVVTTILGALFLVVLARTARITSATAEPPAAGARGGVSATRYRMTLAVLVLVLAGVAVGAVLLGDAKLLLGDVVTWVTGQAGPIVTGVLDTRVPRVVAALLAGAALALGGALTQAVARNPLAEPGMIGVVGGAGLGAVAVITAVSGAGFWTLTGSAGLGAALAMAVVFAVAARGGFTSERLVLIGFGVHAASQAVVTLLITLSDPWNETKALTWLGGSTYGRAFPHLVPMALALLVVTPVLVRTRRELDLLALDDETPRVLGVPVTRTRLLLLSCAVLLTGAAVAGIGVLTFVGLVAPHAARAIVGSRHSRLLPAAAVLGAILVCAADTVGRTVLAPGQLPAGLMTAVLGAPYFVWLLYRHRTAAARGR